MNIRQEAMVYGLWQPVQVLVKGLQSAPPLTIDAMTNDVMTNDVMTIDAMTIDVMTNDSAAHSNPCKVFFTML